MGTFYIDFHRNKFVQKLYSESIDDSHRDSRD